jgi:hypothetical protein
MNIRIAAFCLFFIVMISFFEISVADEEEANDESNVEQTQKPIIQYSKVRAWVSPTFELAFPSSKVTLSFDQPFNRLDLIYYLGSCVSKL